MVKSQLTKSTFREIRSSLGRFMAILAIIGLGVGFFAGLKVAKGAMVATVEGYLWEHEFYDYRLLSTMGFEQESVDYVSSMEGVRSAEGGLSFDVLYYMTTVSDHAADTSEDVRENTGAQGAIKTYSLPEKLNTVKLLAGRMPEAVNECVVDANMLGESSLGSVLVLAEENEEDTLEHFTVREYTVVGLVQSPLYLQYERGNTSLGSGRLNGFVYLLPQGYAEDYFTEIYVKFDNDYALYSDEYESYIEDVEKAWEEYVEQAAALRYDSILADANEELADAKEEFEEKKAEGEEKLADAAATLADAAQKLEDGRQALEDARQELEDAKETLQQKKKELSDAKVTLAQKEQELADGERELQEGLDTWQRSNKQVEDGERELAKQWESLNAQKAALAQTKADLENGWTLYQQLDAINTEIARLEEIIASGGALGPEEGAKLNILKAQQMQMEAAASQLPDQSTILAGLSQVAQSEAVIAGYESQLSDAEDQIADANRQLSQGLQELEDARIEIEDGRQAIEDAKAEIKDGEKAIADAQKELQDAEETLAEKETELIDAQAEYEDGMREYLDAQAEFDEKIADAQAEIDDAQAELSDLEPPDTYLLGRDTNVGYVCFENDSSIVEGIANIFPVFFILVAVLVCVTTMNRMVEEQRTQIGVLKAIGYSEGAIMSKYMIYSGLASVVGCIVGFFLGTWAFPNVIWTAYGIMYRAEDLVYVCDLRMGAFCLGVAIACSVGTTWFSCRVELSQVAAQLMRPKAPKAGKRVLLEKVPFIWNHLSFLRKVSMRNIFRYKKRLFMMVIGISGCTALLVTGFGIKDSIADIAARQFEEIQIFDLAVALQDPADEDTYDDLDRMSSFGVADYLCIMEKNMDLVTDEGIKSIYLVVGEPERMPEFLNLHTETGESIPYPGTGEGVVSNKLAEDYHISVGDTITLRDDGMREITLIVAAIQKNYIYNYVHISDSTWEDQMGEAPERKTVYINVAHDETGMDEHGTAAKLMELDNVSNVTVNLDTMERVGNMMASLNIIVVAVIVSAAGLAFIVLYNLTNINITERIREIATIKVLGFYKKETESYVFRENLILSVLGMGVGLFLGKWLHAYVMNEIRIDMISFEVYVKPVSYLYSALLTIGFAWFVGKAMGGKLDKVSMTESLKSVD